MSKSVMFERRKQAGTWLDDLKKNDPKLAEAYAIVGNQSRDTLRNMVKALSMLTALNTPEDEKRLNAARYILSRTRKGASGDDAFSSDRDPDVEQTKTAAEPGEEGDASAPPAAGTPPPAPLADVTDHGFYVNLIQTAKNWLRIVPNTAQVAEFIEDNEHHLPTDALEALGRFVNPERKSNAIWSDDTVLARLLEDFLQHEWTLVEPKDIGALTSAPILEAPDGRIYWHERYQIECAGEMLLTGKIVSFEGAPDNQVLHPDVPKSASRKVAEAPDAASAAPPPPAPEASDPAVAAPAGRYKYWTKEMLNDCIEALTKTTDFGNNKAAQEAVAGMNAELLSRPVQLEEESRTAAFGAWPVNQETSKVLEGDKSIPDGRKDVEDNTGVTRPSTDTPSKFAAKTCQHGPNEDCMNCSVCGKCDETLDANDVCDSCRRKKKDKKGSVPPVNDNTSRVLEGDKSIPDGRRDVEDHSGVPHPATTDPGKLASVPPVNSDTAKVLEGDKSVVPAATGVEDHTGVTRPATTLPEKLAAASVDPAFLALAHQAIENEADVCYDVAANVGQIFGNVRDMKWFPVAVAEELEGYGLDEARKMVGDTVEGADENTDTGMTGDDHIDEFEASETAPDPDAVADHFASGKTATIEHRPGHRDSKGNEAPWCNVKDGKILDSHATKEEAEKALRAHEYFKGAAKLAAEMTTDKAISLAEKMTEDLKALYLKAKPIASVNNTRPVRDGVESIYQAMVLFDEAVKVLTRQKKQEEDEQAAQEAALTSGKGGRKSARFGGLNLARTASEGSAGAEDKDEDDPDYEGHDSNQG